VPSDAKPGKYTIRVTYDLGPLAGNVTGEKLLDVK
jgi:hypothetical protein